MIYFNPETKRRWSRDWRCCSAGRPLCIGHSETLNDISDALTAGGPSVYRKP